MSRVLTYSAMSGGTPTDSGVWNADCARYQVNDQQGVRARWGLMTGVMDPRWPFANCDGSIETQGPSSGLAQSMAATSESGINGPDAQMRFGKVTDPDNAARNCYYLHRKQADEGVLMRTEMSFSNTFTPVPLAPAAVWIACSMRIPSAWKQAASNDETMVFQVHETTDGGDDTQPAPIGMAVEGTVQRAWVRYNPNATTLQAQTVYTEVWREADYPADQWQHWVFKLRSHWDAAQGPRFEAWRAVGGGALVKLIDHQAPNAYNNTARDYAKHGLYYYDLAWSGGLTSRTMHSKGLYQWMDGQGINESLILDHLRSI